jgi:hypothetical protein
MFNTRCRFVGLVLLVLGVMHFGNLAVLNRMRRRRAPAHPPSMLVDQRLVPANAGSHATP